MKNQGASPEFVKILQEISANFRMRSTGYTDGPVPRMNPQKSLLSRLLKLVVK